MKYVDVEQSFVDSVLAANHLVESKKVEEPEVEVVETTQAHFCPLCESELDEELADKSIKECVDLILNAINEAQNQEGEELSEDVEEEEGEE